MKRRKKNKWIRICAAILTAMMVATMMPTEVLADTPLEREDGEVIDLDIESDVTDTQENAQEEEEVAELNVESEVSEVMENAQTEEEKQLGEQFTAYFVDCGDTTVNDAGEGNTFGIYNSVTDQKYGKDADTGYFWGVVDVEEEYKDKAENVTNGPQPTDGSVYTANTWNWGGNDTKERNRFTKNWLEKRLEKPYYIEYDFEVDPGKYEIAVGCVNPFNCSNTPKITANIGGKEVVLTSETTQYKNETVLSSIKFTDSQGCKEATGTLEVTGEDIAENEKVGENTKLRVRIEGAQTDNCVNVAYILIKKEETENQEKIRKDKMSLSVPRSTMKNLELLNEGTNGSEISWQSNNSTVINSRGGGYKAER